MELNAIVQFLSNHSQLWIAFLIYAVVWAGLWLVTRYFFGDEVGAFVAGVTGMPMFFIYGLWRLVTWPWRYRRQRLFKETFGIVTKGKEWIDIYGEARDFLCSLAQRYDRACNYQIRLQTSGNATTADLIEAAKYVRSERDAFWAAYWRAVNAGYEMVKKGKKPSYTDYL